MKRYINFLKKILILRRIKDGLFATRYFNKKYLQIIKWMFTSKEDTNFTYDLEDKNLNAGYLFDDIYSEMGEILYGDSIESLSNLNENIDLFINDSDHSALYERNEYLTIINKLNINSVILGDNSHSTDELLNFSIINKRNFVLFKEKPKNHWYPGAGIGISYLK